MKQSIQNKMDEIIELARTQRLAGHTAASTASANDSLLSAIRTKEEAELFMAELDAAIKISQNK
jgi:hypothetical protein